MSIGVTWLQAQRLLIASDRLSKFALLLFALAITLAIIVFSASRWNVGDDVLIYGICVAVAVIPESLIAVLTIATALGTRAMARLAARLPGSPDPACWGVPIAAYWDVPARLSGMS